MQTRLDPLIAQSPEGEEAQAILRSCVHCGFCTATCPTYQLLGDERDGPRGRIYLIKHLLEGHEVTEKTRSHLDRCLTCRACETTCPSGVRYGRLLDIARGVLEERIPRPWLQGLQHRLLRAILPHPRRFGAMLRVARWLRPLLPEEIRRKLPQSNRSQAVWPENRHGRRVLLVDGCAQSVLEPGINAAAARLLDRLGIQALRPDMTICCGALSTHLSARAEGRDFMRRNIDAWLPFLDRGAEAIVSTASGCGVMVKDYGEALRHDPDYAEKAAHVSAACRDLAEIVSAEELAPLATKPPRRIAFQAPCTLQHGQKLPGLVEGILTRLGYELTPVADAHLCCGSAGTYSLLQPRLSGQLLERKLSGLTAGEPEEIVTANIGCLLHLRTQARLPVRHWAELIVD